MTTHKPSRETFEKFSQITILFNGAVAFSGSSVECAQFFNLKGSQVDIGDELLGKLSSFAINETQVARLIEKYQTSQYAQNVEQFLQDNQAREKQVPDFPSLLQNGDRREERRWWNKTTFICATMKVLMSRTLKGGGFDVLRSGFMSGVAGAIIGGIFIENQTYTGKVALVYLIISGTMFISYIFLGNRYKAEKVIWEHERDSGTDISWIALLTLQLLKNITSGCIESFSFGSAAYWIGGLNPAIDRYLITILLVVLTGVAVIAQRSS